MRFYCVLLVIIWACLIQGCGDEGEFVLPTPYNGVPLKACEAPVEAVTCTDSDNRFYYKDGWVAATCAPVSQFECWTEIPGIPPVDKSPRLCVGSCTEARNDSGQFWQP